MKKIFLVTAVMAFLVVSAVAQTAPRTINGGVLNGKAMSLPKPVYPDEARLSRVDGTVEINIVIDEGGNVISALAASETGPIVEVAQDASDHQKSERLRLTRQLEDSAIQAALQAKFSPTMLSGVPVKVSGRLVYRFVADSQDDFPEQGKSISGGVLNGKATVLPKPAYPAAAKAVAAEGSVAVKVLVDESGNVIAAEAVSGHPLLRAAAVEAARGVKLSPTRLSGEPVKVSGIIVYNFVAGNRVEVREKVDN